MFFVSLMKIRFELKISFTLFSTQFYLVVFCTVGATSEMVYKFCRRVTIWKGGGVENLTRFIELAQKYSTFFPDSWGKGQFKKKSWNRDIFIDKLIPKENSCFDFAFKNDDLHNLNIVVFTLWLDVFLEEVLSFEIKRNGYFVSKSFLAYCEKKCSSGRETLYSISGM